MGCCISGPIDYEGEVNLYHFDLHRAVGRGAFGKVRVIEHKRTKKLYALKYVDKARCTRQKAVANTIQERRLLEEIDHPFVVNMRYAFQDDENCFFVLDLMLGGDLRFHLERRGPLAEDVVRFWVAELSQGLEYLHRQRIMHRDIKPDNILLDAAGHAHITDFNVAIHYSSKRLHTSVAGSMAYMAPEILERKLGYSWCVDWWSLGVTAYELLFKRRPFEGKTSERMTDAIISEPIKFPKLDDGTVGVKYRETGTRRCSREGASAVRMLLERDPKQRLGCRPNGKGIEDIHNHPWFTGLDWQKLDDKEITPPFVPDMKRANFDVSHELDEFLMVEKPLTHSKRKAHPDLEKMKPELRQLEEQFAVYDFSRTRRMSYYPHNEALVERAAHSRSSSRETGGTSAAATLVPTATLSSRPETPVASPLDPQLQQVPPPLPMEETTRAP